MKQKILTNLKLYHELLKDPTIRKIVGEYEDYTLTSISENCLFLVKETPIKYEKVTISIRTPKSVEHIICELRQSGIIVTRLEKAYNKTAYSNNQDILVNLSEQRFVFTNKTLKKLLTNIDMFFPKDLYAKLRLIGMRTNADMHTHFVTSMKYFIQNSAGKTVQSSYIPTRTYLNDLDITYLYDLVNGNDKLYRIYDLYNGITNERNRKDIETIDLGLLPKQCFNYKLLSGISEKEEALVGKSINQIITGEKIKSFTK